MIYINELKKMLPIKYSDGELDLLSFNDIDWYVDNLRKPYFEEHLDFKFSSDISCTRLKDLIYNMVIGYNIDVNSKAEARLLLKNTSGICGGCTVYEHNTDTLEIAYFVLPCYQHKGVGTRMVDRFCLALSKSKIPFKKIMIQVQYDNKASIKIANELGFIEVNRYQGKYKTNIIMYLDRNKINDT